MHENAKKPVLIQFCRTFKKLFSINYFKELEGTNYLNDFTQILINVTHDLLQKYKDVTSASKLPDYIKFFTTDYEHFDILKKFTCIC